MDRQDSITTFDLIRPDLRGRIVRLNGVLDEILGRHEYPAAVSYLTAEMILLTVLLSSMLKYEGIFSLQAQGDGSVRLLVADMTSQGIIRGSASFRAEDLKKTKTPFELLGQGHLAFTVDQAGTDRYQGIVELKGNSLTECVQHYFRQSEQIQTGILLFAKREETGWRGGGIMLQRVPSSEQETHQEDPEEAWRRVMILMQTCTEKELLDPQIGESDLLFRLFHEEGVKIYDPAAIRHGCRCSQQKIINLLQSMPAQELDSLAQDGKINVNCEFCGRSYNLLRDEVHGKERKA